MFAPDSVKVPVPALVSAPLVVPMMPVMAISPAPLTVKPKVLPLMAGRVRSVPALAVKVAPVAVQVLSLVWVSVLVWDLALEVVLTH